MFATIAGLAAKVDLIWGLELLIGRLTEATMIDADGGVFEHSQPLGIGRRPNEEELAELLGVSERTFRGWTRRYEEEGEAGLWDCRLGKASGRRVPSDRAEEVERLYRERYQGFTVKHFHEHLVKDHGFGWGYTWTKLHLQWAGLAPKAPRKGAHRRGAA